MTEVLQTLASFKLKERRLDECEAFKTLLLEKQLQCSMDLETLRNTYEQFKKNAQRDNTAQINKLKEELNQKEDKLQLSILNEIKAEHEIMTKRAEERLTEVKNAINAQNYFDVAILQTMKDQELAESKIKQLQQTIALLRQRKLQIEQKKKEEDDAKSLQQQVVNNADQVIQQRQKNIETTQFVYKTSEEILHRMQTLSDTIIEYVQKKIQEVTVIANETLKKLLLESVDICFAYHKFMETRRERKARDVQHLSMTFEELKVKLQDANERENLADVAKFQKKKVKKENLLRTSTEEQQRLQIKQSKIVVLLKKPLPALAKMKEERHLPKILSILGEQPK